jgi:hypothetical protein
MFGKFFASAFTGSMRGAGSDVFAVWSYIVSHTINSRVELHPADLAGRIGMSIEDVNTVLEYLQKPDPNSRSKANEGRRMVKEGEYCYWIPNHQAYRDIKDSEDLRLYNANAQRKHRSMVKKPMIDLTPEERALFEKSSNREYRKRRKRIEHDGACDGAAEAINRGLQEAKNSVVDANGGEP